MSGRKCSEFRLQQGREEKLRLLQDLRSLQAEVETLKQRTTALLDSASAGLRATFATEVQYVQRWLDRLTVPDLRDL